jgi:hypothetical protein
MFVFKELFTFFKACGSINESLSVARLASLV